MDLSLKDKVALITGGSRGIGLRTARRFAEEGCHLGLCGRHAADLDAAVKELRGMGVKATTVTADVMSPADCERFVKQCADELGRIDILINNAAGLFGKFRIKDSTDDDWRRTFEMNLIQVVRMTRLAVPHIRKAGGGAIVNISSISGWHAQLSGAGQYGASKGGLIFLTEHMALELVRDNIRVNTVSPGSIIFKDGSWDQFSQTHPESFAAYVRDGFPMGRLGTPEEVADVIVFIASPRANWINGRHIPVDGLEQPTPVADFRPW